MQQQYPQANDLVGVPEDLIKNANRSKPILKRELAFGGYNKDITEPYYWHLNFAYFVGKQYFFMKFEDHHYFSENSQFGQNLRQVKGGSIRALQENLNQIIQLVKVHLMPLLKEVKETDFLKKWMDDIYENDKKYQEGLRNGKSKDDPEMKKWANARDEAINHIKDRWVSEVDGGKLWMMNKSSTEQGLDFALLPQLFFGTKLDNPLYLLHGQGKSIKEQLDEYQYQIDISTDAITAVARYHYKFYSWLPSAIKETHTTFNIKIASLKQFYAQLQMYIKIVKPILLEIAKKSESFEKSSMFHNFEEHNPEFWNLLEYSYSYVKLMGVRKYPKELGDINYLTFDRFGLFIPGSQIAYGKHKGEDCIIFEDLGDKYKAKWFRGGTKEKAKNMTKEQFDSLETIEIDKKDIKTHPCIELSFSQRRRSEVFESQQGPMQVPYMKNGVEYVGYAWNLFEIASYREFLRQDDLNLLETFVEEINVIKEDLLHYVGVLDAPSTFDPTKSKDDINNEKEENSKKNKLSVKETVKTVFMPLEGLWNVFSPLVPSIQLRKPVKKQEPNQQRDNEHEIVKASVAEDLWKGYTVFKKSHGFIQY